MKAIYFIDDKRFLASPSPTQKPAIEALCANSNSPFVQNPFRLPGSPYIVSGRCVMASFRSKIDTQRKCNADGALLPPLSPSALYRRYICRICVRRAISWRGGIDRLRAKRRTGSNSTCRYSTASNWVGTARAQ